MPVLSGCRLSACSWSIPEGVIISLVCSSCWFISSSALGECSIEMKIDLSHEVALTTISIKLMCG